MSTQRCYSESRGKIIYANLGAEPHPLVADLPRPSPADLDRRPRVPGASQVQFLEKESEEDFSSDVEQFWQTLEADGLAPAFKGFLMYNPASKAMVKKSNAMIKFGKSIMPEKLSMYFANYFHKELEHKEPTGIIRCVDWHPRATKVAIALKDDSIKVWYGDKSNVTPLLKHKRQTKVNVIAWKPVVEEILVVGCYDCAILWTVEPSSMSARPGSGCAQVISSPGGMPVHSLSWDPASSLLALSSKQASCVEVWDSDREELVIRKMGTSAVATVLFNPSGERLLLSGQDSLSVFSCLDWKVETWRNLEGVVKHAAWSADGEKIIFAVHNKLYYIGFNGIIGGDSDAKLLEEFNTEITHLVWHNERIAVASEGDSECQLFSSQNQPSGNLNIEFIGAAPGPSTPDFIHMKSSPDHSPGTLLSIVYPCGEIQNIPLSYKNRANIRDEPNTSRAFQNETQLGYQTAAESSIFGSPFLQRSATSF